MSLFVSRQRTDTALAAHALGYAWRLGGHEAFVDTGSIGGGQLYRQVISSALASSYVDACVTAVPTLAVTPRRVARVLRVDDRPANNAYESKWLRAHGTVFDCVVSTKEARRPKVAIARSRPHPF